MIWGYRHAGKLSYIIQIQWIVTPFSPCFKVVIFKSWHFMGYTWIYDIQWYTQFSDTPNPIVMLMEQGSKFINRLILDDFCGWQHFTSETSTSRYRTPTQRQTSQIPLKWVCLKIDENSVPLNTMVLLIIIPIKWLYNWEYNTLFSDKPK